MGKFLIIFFSIVLFSCATQSQEPDINPPDITADIPDAIDTISDFPPEEIQISCTRNEDCDDGIDCTHDICTVDGTCNRIPDDGLCPPDYKCSPISGCSQFECSDDIECIERDGNFCNGNEKCYNGRCWPGTPRDCDDGNPCTNDRCDTDLDKCINEWISSCSQDASTDAEEIEPFDPAVHYSGTFDIVPTLRSDCGQASYNISFLQFSKNATTLTVQAGGFPMTQQPPPDGPSFSVSYSQGSCGVYELTGTFNNANEFLGHWNATFSGTCSICSPQSFNIYGIRR